MANDNIEVMEHWKVREHWTNAVIKFYDEKFTRQNDKFTLIIGILLLLPLPVIYKYFDLKHYSEIFGQVVLLVLIVYFFCKTFRLILKRRKRLL
jgi:phosphoglycerol transferase MdoB-like AlkP superfamily enzyme